MPLNRSNPPQDPARDIASVKKFSVDNLHPDALDGPVVEFDIVGGYLSEGSHVWVESRIVTLTGQDAVDFLASDPTTYGAVKAAVYQKLIDMGIEDGVIV